MNWYKIAQQIHEQHRRDYTAWDSDLFDTLSDKEQDEYMTEMNRKRRAWNDSMQQSLSIGRTSPSEATERGYLEVKNDDIKPLPNQLFHVTTAKTSVIKDSLKTRNELKQDFGKGLGGGTADTLSFTDDIDIAIGIYKAMLEGKKVASGEMTARDMVSSAINGEGAEKPWIDDIKQYRKIKTDQDLEQFVNNLDGDYTLTPSYFPATVEEFNKKNEGEWEPVLTSKWEYSGDGQDRYIQFKKQATIEEQRDRVFDFYKAWSSFREGVGGPLNPLFFSTDVMGLASITEEEIAVLEFKPRPGAQGYKVSSLGEWRTWSGNAVEFVREIK